MGFHLALPARLPEERHVGSEGARARGESEGSCPDGRRPGAAGCVPEVGPRNRVQGEWHRASDVVAPVNRGRSRRRRFGVEKPVSRDSTERILNLRGEGIED